jgi:hypothetical protein
MYFDVMLMAIVRRDFLQQRNKLPLIHKEGQLEHRFCQCDPYLSRFLKHNFVF